MPIFVTLPTKIVVALITLGQTQTFDLWAEILAAIPVDVAGWELYSSTDSSSLSRGTTLALLVCSVYYANSRIHKITAIVLLLLLSRWSFSAFWQMF